MFNPLHNPTRHNVLWPPPTPPWGVLQVVAVMICLLGMHSRAAAQEIKIWEYSPYDVEIWYTFDSSFTGSQLGREMFIRDLEADLDRTFRATWNTSLSPISPEFGGHVVRNFESFSLQDLTNNELVLVVSLKHEQAKSLRTFEAALEALSEISLSADALSLLNASAARFQVPDDSPTAKLVEKCVVDEGGLAAIEEKLLSSSIGGALIPRSALPDVAEAVRPLITLLPWQSDTLLRRRDKLFFLVIGSRGDDLTFKVRELDCPMQFLGPVFESTTSYWPLASRIASATFNKAFAPVARVEDAKAKTAKLRLRAGGLIVSDENPASITVGDVLQPIVRRDDRNGVPALLQPLAWTFAAVTAIDRARVKLDANVYGYSGGPGLTGRKNRRTQRVLLKVRPKYDKTDIKVAIRGSDGLPQPGCFIYRRDLLTNEYDFLGRTDWRGRFTVEVPDDYGGFLPEAIRRQRYQAKKEAEKAAEEAAQAETENANTEVEGSEAETEGAESEELPESAEDKPAVPAPDGPTDDPDVIPLRFALMQIYVKSGDNIMAMLPMVPGLKTIEIAELRDDSRRLQAESFVRGFQGEILDLIGLRNLLAAQITLYLKDKDFEEAEKALDQLRGLQSYNEMADELGLIQRRMLDEKDGPIPPLAKSRIDRMFKTTLDMLQKYLQDDLVGKSERAVSDAKESPGSATPDAEPVAANDT